VTQLTKPSRRGPCIILMGTLSCLESRMSTFRQCDLCVPSHVTHGVICFSPPPRLLYFAVQIRKHLLYHLNLSKSIPHESPDFDPWLGSGPSSLVANLTRPPSRSSVRAIYILLRTSVSGVRRVVSLRRWRGRGRPFHKSSALRWSKLDVLDGYFTLGNAGLEQWTVISCTMLVAYTTPQRQRTWSVAIVSFLVVMRYKIGSPRDCIHAPPQEIQRPEACRIVI